MIEMASIAHRRVDKIVFYLVIGVQRRENEEKRLKQKAANHNKGFNVSGNYCCKCILAVSCHCELYS